MPGLVLFNRRWSIGSDDFVFPSIADLGIRFLWLISLASIYAAHSYEFECTNGNILKDVYIGTIGLDCIGIVNTLVLLCISMKGSIKDNWPRRHIFWPLYIKLFLIIPEAAWLCLCTSWMFGRDFSCDWTVVWTARGTVLCAWLVGFLIFVGILIVFDPLGSAKYRNAIQCDLAADGNPVISVGRSAANKVWERRCRLLCCCIACQNDTQNAFTDVGGIVANFFKDLDLVPSDIGAGLMLVSRQQQLAGMDSTDPFEVQIQGRGAVSDVVSSAASSNLPVPKPWMSPKYAMGSPVFFVMNGVLQVRNMAHFMRYVMGSYGWPLFVYSHLCTGFWRLCCACRCCARLRSEDNIKSDNTCQCNTTAIRKWTEKMNSTLIYVSFHNTYKEVPFYVAADHSKNVVIVSIRGTMSLKDGLADLTATAAKLDVAGLGEDTFCHEAMLDCARYIQANLDNLGLLRDAFAKLKDDAGLVVTGHSLGAGVASILAILLRPTYPDIMCFAFSPPGGLLSSSLSKYTQDFVCSVVVGKDLVPRLGMHTLTDLKVKVLKAILACDRPKYQILARGFLQLLCCCLAGERGNDAEREPLTPRSDTRSYDSHARVSIQTSLQACERDLEENVRQHWPGHPPGQILHVTDISLERPGCLCPDPVYRCYWTDRSSFSQIVLARSMLSDHLPNVVLDALEQMVESNVHPHTREITS